MKTTVSRSDRPLVAVYSADADRRARVAELLGGIPSYETTKADIAAFLAGPPGKKPPAAVILDVDTGDLLEDPRLGAARQRWGTTPIIAISADMPASRARQLVRLRATDWLQEPYAVADLATALGHAAGQRHGDSRVVTFVSASGGAGASTLALMAAQHLADTAEPGSTCLVDLDFQQASCGAYLNLVSEFDLDGVVAHPERLDGELLETLKLAGDGRPTIYSFERPDLTLAATGRAFVLRLLDLATVAHRQVVIDLPRLETPWFSEVVSGSDVVFVVFELNIPSLRQARQILKRVREARGGSENVLPIANKAKFKLLGNPISRKDVAKVFTNGAVFSVARDDALATDALNRAMLPPEISKRSKFVKEATHVFRTILSGNKSD